MKRKIFKLVTTILATLVLTPIFVIGVMHISDLFPNRNESTIEEVKIYIPRNVNEKFTYGDKKFDYLTDKDYFTYVTEDDYKIEQYKDKKLYGSTTKFDNDKIEIEALGTYDLFAKKDDPIVNIIPREFFNCRSGDSGYLYIGKEWGWFVKTEEFVFDYTTDQWDVNSNKVTVMVFDITQTKLKDPNDPRSNDPTIYNQNPDMISSEVKVLFQYEYQFVKLDEEGRWDKDVGDCESVMYTGSKEDLKKNGNTLIVPMPQKDGNKYVFDYIANTDKAFWRFLESKKNRYALTDIAFRKDLVNEQHSDRVLDFANPATINNAYIPENDNGNFMIRADYSFSGSDNSDYNYDNLAKAYFGFFTSFIPGPVGTVVGIGMSGVELISEGIKLYTAEQASVSYDGKLGAQCYYTTKVDQLKYYGGLKKSASIGLTPEISNKPVYLQTDEFAKAEFTLSRTEKWHTRVANSVFISVMDTYSDIEVSKECKTYFDFADNQPEYKPAEVNIKNWVNVLPDGNDYYAFKPEFSGYYTFKTGAKKTEIEVLKGDERIEYKAGEDNEIKLLLKEGTEYRIRVASALENKDKVWDEFEFWIEFSPPKLGVDKPSEAFTLKPQEYIFFEFVPETAAPYMIKTHEKLEIRVYDEYLNPVINYNGTQDNDYIGYGEINALFKRGLNKRYYVGIRNIQDTNGETITSEVRAIAPIPLELNAQHNLNSLRAGNAAYYSFTPKYSGNYKFSSSKISALSIHSNSDTLFLLKNSSTNSLEYFLIEGQTYYFKVTNTNNTFDSTIYSSEQKVTLNPLSVRFGENKVFNEQEYTWYSFKASMDGEYSLDIKYSPNTLNKNTKFSIYDLNLNPVEINDYYTLNKNEIYFIRQQDDGKMFEEVTLTIGLNVNNVKINNEESLALNGSGYTNLKFKASAEGYYSFTANCNIEIYSSDLILLWRGNNSLRANMFKDREYYIHLSGAADSQVNFYAAFDPDHINLNTANAISGNIQSKFFQYTSESNNRHTVYTFGDLDIKTKIIIYDENLENPVVLYNGGHANYKYDFSLGKKYYIEVIRVSGAGPFGFKVEELSVQNGYAVIYEGEKLDGPDSSFNSKNFKFKATKTADFEIRLSKNRYDNFIVKVYNTSGELQIVKSQNDKSSGETEIMKVYTYRLTADTEYIIMIDSVNIDVKAPVLTVVVPVTSFKVAFEGESIENTNQVIHVKQLNNYKLTITTNEGASLFEPMLTFDKPSSIGYFEWDGQYIIDFTVYEFAPVNHTISLVIELDGIKFPALTFIIDYRYDLAGKTTTDEKTGKSEYEIFKANDSESEIQNLAGLINAVTEVKYLDGTPLYILPWNFSFKFDLSKINYDKDINIITILYFEQEYYINGVRYVNKFSVVVETEHNYNADYTSLVDLVTAFNAAEANKFTKPVVFVSLAGATANNNRIIKIPACVEVLNIKGTKNYNYKNVRFETEVRTTPLTLNFADFSFAAHERYTAINCGNSNYDLTLNIIGVCGITGGAGVSGNNTSTIHGGNGITAKNLNINGTLAGLESLTITGGKGGDGTGTYNKVVYNPGFNYEVTSMYGGNGGDGISCSNLITNISGLTVTGGSGGVGAVNNGTSGADKPKNNAGKGAKGDNGTDGLIGGKGGDGGYGIACTSLVNQSGSSIIIQGGSGGDAGRGGNGGAGGKGGDGNDSDMWNYAGDGGDGGSGGIGANGGNGGNAGKAISLSSCANATLLNSSGGRAGDKGTGGDGGAGGKGGNGFWGHGTDGKAGVKGGDGKAGTPGTNVTYP